MEHMAEDPDTVMAVPVTAVTVTPCEDGPLLVRGPFTLMTQDGRRIDPGRAMVALCRCGRSATKPFCDGSHKAAGFRATSEPDPPA
ncbi:CDGSH iron-sulfur domain-containing protein [Microbispora sp. CSR-4]|uniref:CDGSH iron-sulfur domain-containing protein n=1 Tax=Microbispora sp. CSR-4 TaxID=2592813 RepID=UPI0021C6CED7|nr:CDGSH iron-sulfur domain-containing protein [Microbispora sp. CSR-4]